MQSFDNFIASTKNNIMKKMLNYTDPEYYLIKYKPVLDTEETKFIQIYQNVYLMQGISLLTIIPTGIYLLSLRKYRRNFEANVPGFTNEGMKTKTKRLFIYLSFSTVLAIQSQLYAYFNGLSRLMKEIGNRQKQAYDEGRLVQL